MDDDKLRRGAEYFDRIDFGLRMYWLGKRSETVSGSERMAELDATWERLWPNDPQAPWKAAA